ncbi:MAG: hypothetical protein NZM04_07195 [Methylacidiphilales bacterium]|nr:hypothetical protein [Candidatus Methylacidiphilales bacterium]MDW8349247.1 hypothetical protein [Verrucomicrobiae bacterium]
MKILLLLLSFILSSCTPPSPATSSSSPESASAEQPADIPQEEVQEGDPIQNKIDAHPIEQRLQEDMMRASDDREIHLALYTAQMEWTDEIRKLHAQILDMLKDPEERALMQKNIDAWNSLAESEEELLKSIHSTIQGEAYISSFPELAYQIQRDRVAKLYHLIDEIEFRDRSCQKKP